MLYFTEISTNDTIIINGAGPFPICYAYKVAPLPIFLLYRAFGCWLMDLNFFVLKHLMKFEISPINGRRL